MLLAFAPQAGVEDPAQFGCQALGQLRPRAHDNSFVESKVAFDTVPSSITREFTDCVPRLDRQVQDGLPAFPYLDLPAARE